MILDFFIWTFVLYWIHRAVHKIPGLNRFHADHHSFIRKNKVKWHWSNLFLFNDTVKSTVDLWVTEVIPTIIVAFALNAPWLCLFYYLWAAFIQESIEHNDRFDLPLLTSGKWHLIHHARASKNFGLFFPLWDVLFRTNKKVH